MKIGEIAIKAVHVGEVAAKALAIGVNKIWQVVKYIIFKDPVVEKICAENWGDGVGISEEQAAKITDIGTTFQGNTEITSFDEFEKFGITKISTNAFYGCVNLDTIILPNSVQSIGYTSFGNCKNLRRVNIPSSLRVFGDYPFFNAVSISEVCIDSFEHIFDISYAANAGFPTHETKDGIDTHIYINNVLLTEAIIPEGKTLIPAGLLKGNKDVTTAVIPNTITYIGSRAFLGCTNLEMDCFVIPEGVTVIKLQTFYKCTKIRSFSLPQTLTEIDNYAFASSGDYAEIKIPSGVASIGGAAFWNCNITNFVCYAKTPPKIENYAISGKNIYIPDESVEDYKSATNWSAYADRIKPLSEYVEPTNNE